MAINVLNVQFLLEMVNHYQYNTAISATDCGCSWLINKVSGVIDLAKVVIFRRQKHGCSADP